MRKPHHISLFFIFFNSSRINTVHHEKNNKKSELLSLFLKFVSVVNRAGVPVLLNLPERAFDLHSDFYFLGSAINDLGGDVRSFNEFDNSYRIRRLLFKIAWSDMDDAVGNDLTVSREFCLFHLSDAFTPTIRTRFSGREVDAFAYFTSVSHEIVPLRDFSPESRDSFFHVYIASMIWTTPVAPEPPTLWASPIFASFTCRFPASFRSCKVTSTICATPVAPTG